MTDISVLDRPLDIIVISGGISHERDVSLRSGRRVADRLSAMGHRVAMHEPDAALLTTLLHKRPDVVWPAVHGASGEDGALLGLLEAAGFSYVGSRTDAARLAWFKPTAKTLVARAGFSTPHSITLPRETFRELGAVGILEQVVAHLPGPLVVKPAQGGSAQGVSIVLDPEELPRAMVEAYTYGEVVLIEQQIRGTEVSVGVLDLGDGAFALPPVEIEPVAGRYTFEARYNAGETRFYTPARISSEQLEDVCRVAVAIHELLGLRHLSRIDFIVDGSGTPWFFDANVLPGMTETSLVPQAIEASGRYLGDVYSTLARLAIDS
ncbi:D-alanine--D-alanine ligase family protein [Rathayibacter iranicus]|uniref:D-alanine--D-alanine ligase n=2 Tax=Rathayibacter iranicus TaxID=59737 RepID=A0AAD1AE59_9MICO|nr:D-alanine--D-alanine ligase [Rathayibacter iranicus]AZZ56568.1 D-alanine--D-alanine ligase [Rathayibacter iranicus]MWV31885.1 D-alanine--D-alanine ligase [Rathayibacter iranicus NCPPB 2253 = VKM Ac-1602]PPI43490.1 D-alanine--D-alanine ligase [Rathayibacter iranicus]PPI58753.1 D-alanine--D-alanine ligase [Rathayibacter iranicus]PPI69699.1 D-alanine--D-alanine ligase [Rathayibacter iranicus]